MMQSTKTTRFIAGCMTGTSLDGLDIAVVQIGGHGLQMNVTLIEQASFPLGGLADALKNLAMDQPVTPSSMLRIQREFGEVHANALANLESADALDFVVAHGQTIRHLPDEHLSWQLFDPWPIVRKLNVPVCYDLRQADLIAHGNGAPITPMSDWIMYRSPDMPRWIVNLGGICNVTYLPADEVDTEKSLNHIQGMDIGPCNLLLDTLAQKLFPGHAFDVDGQFASRGQMVMDLLPVIQDAAFFKRPLPRTTGREDFDQPWVESILESLDAKPEDILCSAVDAIARMIGQIIGSQTQGQIVLAGGSSQHPLLVERIAEHAKGQNVLLSDDLDIPVEMREAMGMAILGALSQDGLPITLPQITGASNPACSGTWVGL